MMSDGPVVRRIARSTIIRLAISMAVFVALAIGIAIPNNAAADEFRKCEFKFTVSASGLPETEIPGVRYTVWARYLFASDSWDVINTFARNCGIALSHDDYDTAPVNCEKNTITLNQGGWGAGVSGLGTYKVKSLLKDVICRQARRPVSGSSSTDERSLPGFTAIVGPVGNSDACKRQVVRGPRDLTIHCRSHGQDTQAVWHHDLPEPLARATATDAEIGQWKIGAPLARVRTLDGVHPFGRPIPMTVDVSNFTGKHHRAGMPGSVSLRMLGKGIKHVADLSLMPVDDLDSEAHAFSVVPPTPGKHFYFACLTGLRTPAGWPMAEICSSRTFVDVGFPSEKSAPADAGRAPPDAAIPAERLTPAPLARQPNPILPALQPRQEDSFACTGGRSPNAQGRCVCPAGREWNAAANRCTASQQAGSGSGRLECRGGEVRGILCWCGIGRFPRHIEGNVYQCQ